MKKDKDKDKKKKDSLGTKEIIRHNLWALRHIHDASKGFIAIRLITCIYFAISQFIIDSFLLRHILNRYQEGNATATELVITIVAIYIGHFALLYIRQAVGHFVLPKMRMRITAKITKSLFKKSLSADLACYEDPDFYDKYVKAMDEAAGRMYGVLDTLCNLFEVIVMVLANGLLLITIDWYLIFFTAFPILFGLLRKKELAVYYRYVADQKPIDRRKKYIRRTFYLNEYAKEMRLTDMKDSQIETFDGLYGDYKKVLRKHGPLRTFLGFIGEFSGDVITSVGAAVYAVYLAVVKKSILIGDCAVTINAISQLGWVLNRSVTDFAGFSEHALYIRDMRDFLDYDPKIKEDPNAPEAKEGIIRFENVSFTYFGAKEKVLDNVSFTLEPGKRFALVGCNGAGKSTIVKLLLRLYDPTEGRITLDGVDIRTLRLSSYRNLFSVMFQDYKCLSMSVAENVMQGPYTEQDKEKVVNSLKESGAWEKIETLPHGIDTTLTKEFDPEGTVLSGGENQKVQLAAVFAKNAPVAILDEPSSALDPIAEYKVFESMIRATEGKLVLFISHRLSSAVLADTVLVLENGLLVQCGSHNELLTHTDGVYAQMFNRQAENYFDEEVAQ